MNLEKFSLMSRAGSFRNAFRGLATLFREEPNAIIHLLAAIAVICAGLLLKINRFEWCILAIVAGFVFGAEIFNTSIESLGDAIDPGWNKHIKKAKDLAAAGVLVAAIISVIAGFLIFIPRIISIFQGN